MTGGTTPQPPDDRPPAGGSGGWDNLPPPPPTGQSGQGRTGEGPGWTGQGQGGSGWSGQGRSGLDANVAAGLAYTLTILTGAIFLVIDRRPEVRFHAMQAIIFGIAWALVGILRGVLRFFPFNLVLGLAWFAGLVLWVVLMIQAFQGNHFKLPYIGDLAEQQTGRTS